jgi:adenosylcobinamide-phosphate synthase
LYHPVRGIGWLCTRFETIARKRFLSIPLGLKGVVVAVSVIGTVFFLLVIILTCAGMFSPYFRMVFCLFFLYTGIAAGDLFKHSREVARELSSGKLESARRSVAMLVGRDTTSLDGSEISRACVESVSENFVDGITAPVFWGVVAAIVSLILQADTLSMAVYGVYLYKSVNTMDSMIGYKNDEYMDFGRFAAKTDDVFNFIPARISGVIVVAAAALMKLNTLESWKTFCEDRLKSSSPNSGHTEAAVAGALQIQLGGSSYYFGKVQTKPFIGSGFRKPDGEDIYRANRLVLVSSAIFIFLSLLLFNVSLLVVT